jgi:long-chain fatty acid transport protein
MKRLTKNFLTVAVTAALFAPMAAMATNGYFAHGYGTKNKGLAGGGAALAQDSMIAATNPAGMVLVGNRMDIGAAIFSPNPRSYTATGTAGVPDGFGCGALCPFEVGPQSIDSESDVFLIPHFGRNWMLDTSSSIGVSVYGNGGMNTNYKGGSAQHNNGLGVAVTTPGTFGAGNTGVNLKQLFIATTYARKIDDKSSWGVTPIIVYQTFEAKGVASFAGFSEDPSSLSNNGASTSTGYGLKLGIMGEVSPGVTVAGSYQTKMDMSEFDDYAGLFAEDGDFDIPATMTLGLAWATSSDTVVTVDLQKIYYAGVDSIANPQMLHLGGCAAGPTGGTGATCLGGSNGTGFGWEDMTILKLGYQWAGSNGYTWRAGISHGKQPIPDDVNTIFNILAPAVIETHITGGFTKDMGAGSELNFAAMYAPTASVKGENPFDPAQEIELEMSQWELEGSWAVKF